MILDKTTPIVIYGCGYLGVLLLKTLETQGLKVECGIDKRGDELESFCGKPAYSLDTADRIADKSDKLLVVAVKNVFEHESIAKMLNGLGFRYILYKPGKILEGKSDDYSSSISDVYEKLLLLSRPKDQQMGGGGILEGSEIAPYRSYGRVYEDHHSIKQGDDVIISFVPTAMIFTDETKNRKDTRNVSDVPLVMSLSYFELYDYFRFNRKYPAKYIEFCKSAVNSEEVKPTERWINNIFENRYMIYVNMLNNLNLDFDFFRRNAPLARWNDKGYFNLMGGKSRSTFLISRDYHYIPLKITKADYDRWFNGEYIKTNFTTDDVTNLDNFIEPIEHPAFFDIPCDNAPFYFALQRGVMKYLAQSYGYPAVKQISVLDVSRNNGFIGRMLSRIVDVTDVMRSSIENEGLFSKLATLLQADRLNVVEGVTKRYNVIIADAETYDEAKANGADIIFVHYAFDDREKYAAEGFTKLGNGVRNYRQWEFAVKSEIQNAGD